MASSMTTQTMACTVKSVHQGNIAGQAVTVVSCRVGAATANGSPKSMYGNGVTTGDLSFIMTTGTVPAVGDTMNLIMN